MAYAFQKLLSMVLVFVTLLGFVVFPHVILQLAPNKGDVVLLVVSGWALNILFYIALRYVLSWTKKMMAA